jgi:hypothetical protein
LISYIKFIARYINFFEALVNGIVSLISFSVCELLIYRKADIQVYRKDFCMLILYPATLPKEFMISNSFLVVWGDVLGKGSCQLQIGVV